MPALSQRLETMISSGLFAPGDRLPAERQFATELGVSRSQLREAIKQLASRGLLASQQGGGTYVTTPEAAEPVRTALQSLAPLVQSEAGYWRDVIEIRKSLEGDAAAYAAMRADEEDKNRMASAYEALSDALLSSPSSNRDKAPQPLAKLDARFHMLIARAAHNAVLYQIMEGLEGLLEASISGSLARLYRLPGVPEQLDTQHHDILDAISEGRPEAARAAAMRHLVFIEDQLERLEAGAERQRRSMNAFRLLKIGPE